MDGLRFPELSEIPEGVDLRDVAAGLESLLASELPDPDGSMRRLADELAERLRGQEGGVLSVATENVRDLAPPLTADQIHAAGARRAQRFP